MREEAFSDDRVSPQEKVGVIADAYNNRDPPRPQEQLGTGDKPVYTKAQKPMLTFSLSSPPQEPGQAIPCRRRLSSFAPYEGRVQR